MSSAETKPAEERAMIAAARLVGHAKDCAFVLDGKARQCTCALQLLPATTQAADELAIVHARYEFVRTLTPRSFKKIWDENLKGVGSFDSLVDTAIKRTAVNGEGSR